MRHDWIFDVLSDLKAYAVANGMTALARKADETMAIAREEVGRANPADDTPHGGTPPQDTRAH